MARITIYKNSVLATIVSFLGYFCIAIGAVGLVSGEILMGIVFLAIGVGVSFLAGWISDHKAFRTWWKQVEQKGLIPEIQKSAETAVAVYRKNPDKRTLKKIRALNPPAAAYIEGGCKGPVPQMMIQKPVQRPAQQPAQQTRSSYSPPVYQTPAAGQASGPQAVYQMFRNDYNGIDEYVDDVQRVYNGNTQKDPEVYWQCAKRLEMMSSAFPDNERLLKLMAKCVNEYSVYFKPQTFADRRRVCYALKQVLEMKPRSFSWNLDAQKFNMIYHVIHASIQAVNTDDVPAMEEVWKWLHTASQNRMLNMNDRDRQYQEVALPSAWLFTGYWLARAYLAQGQENKRKAAGVLEEALQACSLALVRQCDLNPGRSTDQQKVISRDEVLELWRSTMA